MKSTDSDTGVTFACGTLDLLIFDCHKLQYVKLLRDSVLTGDKLDVVIVLYLQNSPYSHLAPRSSSSCATAGLAFLLIIAVCNGVKPTRSRVSSCTSAPWSSNSRTISRFPDRTAK